ncbi:beta strand repeat-containing protein [Limnohabitans sp.]
MTTSLKANVKAIVKLQGAAAKSYSLSELSALKLSKGALITLVDSDNKPVKGLLAKRKGQDLVLELEGQGEVATLGDFYSVEGQVFYPNGEIPAGNTTAGGVTAQTPSSGMTGGGDAVVYKSSAGFGSSALMVAGGLGLAAAAGGGGSSGDAVVQAPREVFRLVQNDGGLKIFDANADPLHQDKLRSVTPSGLGKPASDPLVIPTGETYVMDLSLLKTLQSVTGKGNLWILVDTANDTVELNIQLQGGTLTFDMRSDLSVVTVDSASTVNLGGGKLVVSDGQVFVNATTFASWNVGEVILNSVLTLDFTTTTWTSDQIRALVSSVDASGQGELQILVANEAQAQVILDAMAQNASLNSGPAPTITIDGPTINPVNVDLTKITDAKIQLAVDALEAKIAALQAQITSNDVDIAAIIDDALTNSGTATTNSIAGLKAAIVALQTLVGTDSVSKQIADAIGKPSTTVPLAAATGLWADIESVLNAAVTLLEADITALQTQITNNTGDIADLLNDGSGVFGLPGYVAPTTASLAGLEALIRSLNTGAAADISALQTALGQANTAVAPAASNATGLYATIEAAVAAAVSALQTDITALQTQITNNTGDIADLLDDSVGTFGQPGYVAPTTASLAGLQAMIEGLSTGAASDISALQTALGQANTAVAPAASNATGLYATIEAAVAAAVSALQTDITALQTQITNNTGDIADLLDDSVGTFGQPGYVAPTTASLAGLQAMIEGLSTGAASDISALQTALGQANTAVAPAASNATGLYATIEAAVAAAVSALQTDITALQTQITNNTGDIADLLNDGSGVFGLPGYVAPTTASLAGLEALIRSLNTGAAADISALQTALGQANTAVAPAASNATGLYATIEAAVAAAVNELNQDITRLQTAVDSNAANTALIKDDTNAVNNLSGLPTTNSIAGLKAALLALQSSSSSAGGDLTALASRVLALENSLDETAPKITDIAITASNPDANGAYGEGDVVRVTVTFDEAVLVKGAPTFALDVGAPPAVQAALVGGAGTNKLVFEYTLTGAQTDANGIGAAANALKLNSGAITDAAGNSAVITSDLIADSSSLKVDNTPLSVTMSAGALFGSRINADNVLIGFLDDQGTQVFLSDLDSNGFYQVPVGTQFLNIDAFIRYELMGDSTVLNEAVAGGSSTFIDLSDKLAIAFGPGFYVVMTEASFTNFVNAITQNNPSNPFSDIAAFLAAYSVPAESVWLYDGANAGETLSAEFLAAVQGRNPADVVLDITSSLTVAQAAKLIDAGFNLVDNATYTVRDWDTTIQAGMLNADTRAALQGATQVVARGDELANAMRFTSFDQSVNLRVEAGAGNDSIDAGRGNDTIVGQAGGDTINLTSADTSRDTVVYQTINDGASLPVSTVTFSTDPDDYRVGSVLTVTINGVEYSHTVSTEYGETITAQTIEAELAAFASEIAALTVPVDNSAAVVA